MFLLLKISPLILSMIKNRLCWAYSISMPFGHEHQQPHTQELSSKDGNSDTSNPNHPNDSGNWCDVFYVLSAATFPHGLKAVPLLKCRAIPNSHSNLMFNIINTISSIISYYNPLSKCDLVPLTFSKKIIIIKKRKLFVRKKFENSPSGNGWSNFLWQIRP